MSLQADEPMSMEYNRVPVSIFSVLAERDWRSTGAGNITSHGLREIGYLICVLLLAVGEQDAN